MNPAFLVHEGPAFLDADWPVWVTPESGKKTVGVWDMDAYVGDLPWLLSLLNDAQDLLHFTEVNASVPAVIVSQPETLRAWAERLDKPFRSEALPNTCNVVAEQLFEQAGSVRQDLRIDYLVIVTGKLIASALDGGDFLADLFSVHDADQGLGLVSTFELARYARQAGRSFEAAVGVLLVTEVLCLVSPGMRCHLEADPDTGCFFDYCYDRDHVVLCLSRMEIEESCLAKIQTEEVRSAGVAMADALRESRRKGMADSVIVVPGIMGSVLKRNGETVWPGPLASMVGEFPDMDAIKSDDLVPTDILREFVIPVSFGNIYKSLMDDLEQLRFHEKTTPATLYACPYDWRKTNALAAKRLADVVDRAAAANTGGQISLVAHSMGGLVSRYYLESGEFNNRPGFAAVTRLITLATPHKGAPEAVLAIRGKLRKAFLSAAQVKELAATPGLCSVYELVPPPGEPFVWNQDASCELAPLDLYTQEVADMVGLSYGALQQGKAFWSKLSMARKPPAVRYFCFAGTKHETITSVLAMSFGSSSRVDAQKQSGGGDGTVPTWSAFEASTQRSFAGQAHMTVFKDRDLRVTLGKVLGRPGVLAPLARAASIAAAEPAVVAGTPLELVMRFAKEGAGAEQEFHGEIRFVKVEVDAVGGQTGVENVISKHPIDYQGSALDSIAVTIQVPDYTGLYRIEIWTRTGASAEASDVILITAA